MSSRDENVTLLRIQLLNTVDERIVSSSHEFYGKMYKHQINATVWVEGRREEATKNKNPKKNSKRKKSFLMKIVAHKQTQIYECFFHSSAWYVTEWRWWQP